MPTNSRAQTGTRSKIRKEMHDLTNIMQAIHEAQNMRSQVEAAQFTCLAQLERLTKSKPAIRPSKRRRCPSSIVSIGERTDRAPEKDALGHKPSSAWDYLRSSPEHSPWWKAAEPSNSAIDKVAEGPVSKADRGENILAVPQDDLSLDLSLDLSPKSNSEGKDEWKTSSVSGLANVVEFDNDPTFVETASPLFGGEWNRDTPIDIADFEFTDFGM